MKPGLGFTPTDARFPFLGLDVNTPPAQLLPGASPNALNTYTFRGSLLKRSGYTQLSTPISMSTDSVVRLFNFQLESGQNLLLAFTPTQIASYDGTNWTDRTPTHKWTGNETNFIDVCQGVDANLGRVVVAVNGNVNRLDGPLFWDGIAPRFAPLSMNLTGFVTAKTCAVYNEYLIFTNLITTTTYEPRTAIWSDTGNFTEWLSGNAGQLSEMNFDGEVIRMIPYATNLVLFSRNSIGCLCYIDPSVIFGNTLYLSGIKLVAPGAVCYLSPYIIFAGQDNLYVWDGTRVIIPFGDKIRPIWLEDRDELHLSRTKLFHDYTIDKIRFIIPTGALTSRYFTLEIDNLMSLMSIMRSEEVENKRIKWHEATYPERIIDYGMYVARVGGQDFSQVVLGSTNSLVYVEGSQNDDNGVAISLTYDTCDHTIPQVYRSQLARWVEFEFEANGTSIDCSYSIDNGATWTFISTTTLTETLTQYKIYFDISSRTIRMRFSNNSLGSTFELTWYRIWFRPGGAR